MDVVVGRVRKAHGIRGEVTVDLHTDEPERRFAVGQVVRVEAPTGRPVDRATLTVSASRWHGPRLLVRFGEVADRAQAERLQGTRLVAAVDEGERPEHPEEFYDRQLVGLLVRTTSDDPVGEVVAVLHLPGQDLLEIRRGDGATSLVPFVAELVPSVDVERGRLVVADRPGLLDPSTSRE